MSKKCCESFHLKKKAGIIISSLGIGMILVVILPFWGWVIAVGAALIFAGWYISENCH